MSDMLEVVDSGGAVDDKKPDTELDLGELKTRWALEIERYERKAQEFERRGKRILDRFIAEKKDENSKTLTFNTLWSNVQTLKPALYAKDPTPEVERRFKDKDPVALVTSDVLERCISYSVGKNGFGDCMKQVVLDRLLPGRGVAWVRYLPHLEKVGNGQVEANVRTDGPQITDDAPEDIEDVTWEEVKYDFVPWTDFGHQVARTWQECDAVWRIAYLDRQGVKKRFGAEIALALQYDQKPEGLDKDTEGVDALNKVKIYEVWDKRTKRVIWINKGHPKALDVKDAPLMLESFWPLPNPLQATTSSKSVIPTADYVQYSDQAAELDRLTHRISMLTRAIKAVGVYDAGTPALQQLLNAGVDNRLIPVDSWAAYAEKGGIQGSVQLLPIEELAKTLIHLYEARDKVKQDLYEISGMSDLLRGANDPSATATAEQIKSQYASVRLKDMQNDVQQFARTLVHITGEIIAGHFTLPTIKKISGVRLLMNAEKQQLQMQIQQGQAYQQHTQMLMQQHQQQQPPQGQPPQPGMPPAPPQPPFNPQIVLGPPPPPPDPEMLKLMNQPSWEDVEALLRDNPGRSFRIDIEIDSTIMQDERQEQDSRMRFADTVGKMVNQIVPEMENMPQLAPALAETFMLVLRSFKIGRSTEVAFQEAMDNIAKIADAPKQPKPDPEQVKAQAAIQQIDAKTQADIKSNQDRVQGDMALDNQKLQNAKELETFKAQTAKDVEMFKQNAQQQQATAQNQIESQRADRDAANDQRLEQMRMAFDAHAKSVDQQIAVLIAHLNNAAKVEVAEIGAQTTIDAAQISAAKAAEGNSDASV